MKQILSKSIVLIGLMGSGKSAIGKMLSEVIGVPFSDTDSIIEKEVGKEINQIFDDSLISLLQLYPDIHYSKVHLS